MEALFLEILNRSLSGGLLIAAVLLLRLFLRRAPKNIRCILWALVALRLLLPSLPESSLSLLPSAAPIPETIAVEPRPRLDTGVEVLNGVVNPVVENSLAPKPGDSVNPVQVLLAVGGRLWLLGMAGMLLYAAVSYGRLRRRTRISIRREDHVYACDGIATPFILGLFRPRIYLPSIMEQEQLAPVLAHERAHLRRRDHWWKPLGFLVLALYWFHPLVWLGYFLFCRDIELACDEAVITGMDAAGKKAYSQALLSFGMRQGKMAACPLAFGEVSVKERIRAVLQYRRASRWLVLLALAACGLFALCFLTNPKTEEARPFGPADFRELEQAVLQGDFGERTLTDPEGLRQLEEKLAAAKARQTGAPCPFPVTLRLYRSDGTEGLVSLASDGCELYLADGKCYDYGVRESGSVLSLFGFEEFREERELDEQGRILRKTAFLWLEPYAVVENSYEGDLQVSRTVKDGFGKLQNRQMYEYDEQGRNTFTHWYLPEESGELHLSHTVETVYDEQGNFVEIRTYRADGSLIEPTPGGSPGLISIDPQIHEPIE